MDELPANLYHASQVREMDRHAINVLGIPGYTLMTRAGDAAVDEIGQRWPQIDTWVSICGGGNNAGDALIVARRGLEAGKRVHVIFASEPGKLRGDAKLALDDFVAAGGVAEAFADKLPDGLLIDGLFGTGLDRDVDGVFADAINAINNSGNPVLALDLPSGLSADTGDVLGSAVRASATISFVGLKLGLFMADGPEHAGQITFSDLGVTSLPEGTAASLELSRVSGLAEFLPRRPRASHKGEYGHVLIIGGGPGMPGAVRLCGEAALRAGAGLVTLATHPGHAASLCGRPELICHGVSEPEELDPLLANATVIAIGPGLGRSDWAEALCRHVIGGDRPMVIDADGLNWLARNPLRHEHWVLTPHPGEAGRLLGSDTQSVQGDRIAAVRALQEQYAGVAVLKGAGTLSFAGKGVPALCRFGNPGMSSAGTGDVLTGIIAAFIAQTSDVQRSARYGTLVHALAGDEAAGGWERGMLAGDLMQGIRRWVNRA